MSRLPASAFIATGAIVAALALTGALYSVHTSAKVVYSGLLVAGLASIWTGYRKRNVA